MDLHRLAAVAGIALPIMAATWWAGSSYVEFADRLSAVEQGNKELQTFRQRYERDQAVDSIINEKVNKLDKEFHDFKERYEREQANADLISANVTKLSNEVDWLRWHHHFVPQGGDTGRAHIDD